MAKVKDNEQQPQEVREIPTELLLEEIRNAVKAMRNMLIKAKNEYGRRYVKTNNYEVTEKRFDLDNTEKVLAEYDLIQKKQSGLPVSVRRVIGQLGDNALRNAYIRTLKALKKQESAAALPKKKRTRKTTKTEKA